MLVYFIMVQTISFDKHENTNENFRENFLNFQQSKKLCSFDDKI